MGVCQGQLALLLCSLLEIDYLGRKAKIRWSLHIVSANIFNYNTIYKNHQKQRAFLSKNLYIKNANQIQLMIAYNFFFVSNIYIMINILAGSNLVSLAQRRADLTNLITKIQTLSKRLQYQGLQRVNSTTLFEVKIKHTNQYTLELGAGYFAEVTSEQAIKILRRRLNVIEGQIKSQQVGKKEEEGVVEKDKKYGKSKSLKIQQGNMKGYLEVVGQQNGEEIFNIVEIQGEEEEVTTNTSNIPAIISNLLPKQVSSSPKAPNQAVKVDNPQSKQQQQLDDIQSPQNSQNLNLSQQDEDGQQDLILSYRTKLVNKTEIETTSTPQILLPKQTIKKQLTSVQQLDEKEDQDNTKVRLKTKKRVSFADERQGGKLAQLLRSDNQYINNKKDKKKKMQKEKEQRQKEKEKIVQKQQQKPKIKTKSKQKGKKQQKIDLNNIDTVMKGKVSRFKLQRMKQRLQKEAQQIQQQ